MKNLMFVLFLNGLFSPIIAHAQCVLSVDGGFNGTATMSYYFENPKIKKGWVAKWDPDHTTGDASIKFKNDEWLNKAHGMEVVSEAILSTKDGIQTEIRATGYGYLEDGADCGQPALGRGYAKAIPRFLKKLAAALPECTAKLQKSESVD